MKNISKLLILLSFAIPLGVVQYLAPEAMAQSSYFTSRGCVDCHSAPTASTCAGCHQHSGSLSATANKTSFAPGETVTITLTASGARSGWIGARLYDQSGAEIARSTGNQSGMGGSAVYPAVLSAPAPAAAGTYTWKMAYFGNQNGTGSGDVHAEKSVNVSITVAAAGDTVAPTVIAFTLPATATSLTVPVTALTATDNTAVTGYLINKSATSPTASATGWTATAPTSVTAVAGSNTFYAWAKDAAGNVSLAKTATVTVTLPDTTLPVVSAFTLPATATSLTVPVTSLTATDNVGVSGYLINKSATAPAATATGWTAAAPASVTAVEGSNTFYAWVKDAAGNVSLGKSAIVTVTLPPAADTAAPSVTAFSLPATASNLTIVVSSFTASDNTAVTGYLVTTSATAPAAGATGWNAFAPTTVTAPAAGSVTFYAWAKDAAGNVSLSRSATVAITIVVADTSAPTVDAFALPATAESLSIPVSSFSASDNTGVIGYLVTTSAAAPAANGAGWSSAPQANVLAPSAGTVTFHAWAKDAAGNVSSARSAAVTITLPTQPPVEGTGNPVLTISTLDDGAVTNRVTLNITGSVIDPDGIKSLTLNDRPVRVKADGSFTVATKLKPGANIIKLVATDNTGVQSEVSRTITYDKSAPKLTVSKPEDHLRTSSSFIDVSGSVNETSTVTVGVNGRSTESASINGDSFSATVYLAPGLNTLIVKGKDVAGNSSSLKRTVFYDNIKPDLAVTSPSKDMTTKNAQLLLKGRVRGTTGDVTVSITAGGTSYTPAVVKGTFSQKIDFTAAGEYEVAVTATDSTGSSTVERTINYQPQVIDDDDDDD